MIYFAGRFPSGFSSHKKYVYKVDEHYYSPKVGDVLEDFCRADSGYKYSNSFIVTDVIKDFDEAAEIALPVLLTEKDIIEVIVYEYISTEDEDKATIKSKSEKENKMNTSIINRDTFKFGKVSTSKLTYSTYGVAVIDNEGRAKAMVDNSIMDVTGFTLDGVLIYQMPVAIKDLKSGDIVLHNGSYMIVVENKGDSFVVIDVANGEDKVIRPFKNVFGFNFMTKVVDLFKTVFPNKPSESNPFGNPLMMMAMSGQKMDSDLMMMMVMMGSSGNGMSPNMMLPLMMKDSDGDGLKDLMLMMMMGQAATPQ